MLSSRSKENQCKEPIAWQSAFAPRVLKQGLATMLCQYFGLHWRDYKITCGFKGASFKERTSHASHLRLYSFRLSTTCSRRAISMNYLEGNLYHPCHSRFRSFNPAKIYPRNLWGFWPKSFRSYFVQPSHHRFEDVLPSAKFTNSRSCGHSHAEALPLPR